MNPDPMSPAIGATGVPAEAAAEEASETRREAIRARLRHLFRRAGDGEANRLLYEVVLEYRLEQAP